MPELSFHIPSVAAVPFAAVPLLAFKLEVVNPDESAQVHSGILRCQIQIEATRRRYDADEQARLLDLFGEPERWNSTLKAMLWTHTTIALPQFVDRTVIDVPVPCSFDFNVAATKYFDGLMSGEVPLNFLFSGTVFYESVADRTLQIAPVSWDKEARCRVPVKVWRDLMDYYYPNGAWLRLRRDTFERLAAYKRLHGIPTWEETVDRILPEGRQVVRS
ncbi:MAG: hypothetical protein H0X67_04185 [Acidobacteria bacterium]|nr:hypothetical protein [Acidobacteriota bacterium]